MTLGGPQIVCNTIEVDTYGWDVGVRLRKTWEGSRSFFRTPSQQPPLPISRTGGFITHFVEFEEVFGLCISSEGLFMGTTFPSDRDETLSVNSIRSEVL